MEEATTLSEHVDLTNDCMDRIMYSLMKCDVPNLSEVKQRLALVLNDYHILPKETALTVYTEGKNDWYLKKFILAKAVAGCSPNTLRNYGNGVKRALDSIGKDADAITSDDIQVLLAKIMQRNSKIYADNVRRVLSSFYGYLHREELIERNPMIRVEKIKVQKKEKAAFSEYDVEMIRNACQNSREKAIVEIMLSTGCRVTELVGISKHDIKEGGQVTINILGKGGKYRNVYLNAKGAIALRGYMEDRKDTNPFLFPKSSVSIGEGGRQGDKMRKVKGEWYKYPELVAEDGACDKSVIENIVRTIGRRAGVENCHPHRFRRTCATFALRRGMPIEQVSKMLGHANIATTQIYLDLSEEDLAQAHRRYVV